MVFKIIIYWKKVVNKYEKEARWFITSHRVHCSIASKLKNIPLVPSYCFTDRRNVHCKVAFGRYTIPTGQKIFNYKFYRQAVPSSWVWTTIMAKFLLLFAMFISVVVMLNAQDCSLKKKKLKRKIRNYKTSCLQRGKLLHVHDIYV